ncbi:molybdenum cofactor guanylyltransferase [Helicobacter mesocricetorum]|uniref:molybdenum cofactor guanylyltransferase n=1 Tax=Helicobacter mesocricetorum TaxID=87012 RepID=UPI000CF01C08|nr:molybdenum cofactor guanylyltransferase [Helicobacter mesocricetorum]
MLTCIILSGGKSSRMGILKQNLDFFGQSLANFQAKNFYQIFKNLYFSSKTPIINDYNVQTILDNENTFAPIFGLKSVLETLQQNIFVISIDTPFLQKNSILKIIESFQQHQKATFAKNEKIHPLIGIYPKDSLPLINNQIQKGNYRLMDLLKNMEPLEFVKISTQESSNLNYPKDYQQAIKRSINGR